MRIGLILPGFSADESDWCIPALLNYVRELAAREEVEVFALRYPNRRGVYKIGDATVHSLGWGQRHGLHSVTLHASAIRLIRERHRSQKIDVLHAFWADEPGRIASWFSDRLPVIVSLAGGELIADSKIGYGLSARRHSRFLIQRTLGRATAVTAGSHYLSVLAQKALGRRQILVAPLGVDLTMWTPRTLSSEHSPTLMNVGSLEPVKGQMHLLAAFRKTLDHFPSARLKIAGDGRLRSALENHAKQLGVIDQVEFCGAIVHHCLPALYSSATLFVQSSLHEAQGMALLEAAATGLPLVGTRVGLLADLSPAAAVATKVGDVDELAEAIMSILRDPRLATSLGREARNRVKGNFSVDSAVERFLTLYRTVR